MIDVYTANTPNGVKVPIALEELAVPYRVIRVDLGALEQKHPDFLRINPNGRIPAIVDSDGPGSSPLSVFESGAILWYLAEKFPGLMPESAAERIRALEYTPAGIALAGGRELLGGRHYELRVVARSAICWRAARRLPRCAGMGHPHGRTTRRNPWVTSDCLTALRSAVVAGLTSMLGQPLCRCLTEPLCKRTC
jgi:glutathione S-transferase